MPLEIPGKRVKFSPIINSHLHLKNHIKNLPKSSETAATRRILEVAVKQL